MLTLSVVVPATDAPPTITSCHRALLASVDPPEEVIVVDGPAWLSASAARNVGAARACGDVIVFVDADVVVHRDALSRIRRTFEASPELGGVFGSYDDAPAGVGLVSQFRNLLHHHVHHESAGSAETFWTGLGAVRRASFLAIGGFDEDRYPHPSVEDIELGCRLRARGETIVLDPTIQGTHLKVWTLRSMVSTDLLRRGIPWVALQVRARRVSGALNCGWRHRASALATLAAVAGALFGRRKVALAGLGALLTLNWSFYRLLGRQRGVAGASMGVLLHGLHHLVGVVAVPCGVVAVLASAPRSRSRPTPLAVIAEQEAA
jgi:hypothetical protein